MTTPLAMDALIRFALLFGGLVLAAALLSAFRITLSRATRREVPDGAGGPSTVARARVLGGLLVANILAHTGAAVVATRFLLGRGGPEGANSATVILLVGGTAIAAEAVARLAVRRGLVERAFFRIGLPFHDYAAKLTARDEIRDRIDLLQSGGEMVKSERDMLGGLLDLGEMTVEDVMVHRTKMRTIDAEEDRDALVAEVLASPHTRLPVWRGEPDNIIGILHAKDLFRAIASPQPQAGFDVETLLTPPWFVPSTTGLRDQLAAFLARKQHFALVVDEYGDLMGLFTLEDILEEIVGDIADEHDVSARGVRPQPDGSLLVDGAVAIRDLNRMMDWSIPDSEATTVAGLVIHEAQTIPDPGQAFTFHGFRFEVLRRVRNRIAALRVSRLATARPMQPERAGEA